MKTDVKKSKPNSGRAFSLEFPKGRRRKARGHELAPRSLRKHSGVLLSECSEKQLKKAGVL